MERQFHKFQYPSIKLERLIDSASLTLRHFFITTSFIKLTSFLHLCSSFDLPFKRFSIVFNAFQNLRIISSMFLLPCSSSLFLTGSTASTSFLLLACVIDDEGLKFITRFFLLFFPFYHRLQAVRVSPFTFFHYLLKDPSLLFYSDKHFFTHPTSNLDWIRENLCRFFPLFISYLLHIPYWFKSSLCVSFVEFVIGNAFDNCFRVNLALFVFILTKKVWK